MLPDPQWYLDNVLVHADPDRSTGAPRTPTARWRSEWRRAARRRDSELVALAIGQGFVVTTGQLRAAGWGDHDLRREVRRGGWWVPARGTASPIVATDERAAHAIRSCAAALLRPGHVITGRSAAILHGLPTLAVPERPELTRTDSTLGRRARVHVRGATLRPEQRCRWYGAPVSTVARTVVDLGRHDRRDAIMAADAALADRQLSLAELGGVLDTARGWVGVRQARDVLACASPRAESPLESIVRLALHDDGFPPPRLQFEIAGYRVDFCWPQYRLILEADGRGKYTSDELWREKRRERRLQAAGYAVERVLWSDVLSRWDEVRASLIRHLPAGVVTSASSR